MAFPKRYVCRLLCATRHPYLRPPAQIRFENPMSGDIFAENPKLLTFGFPQRAAAFIAWKRAYVRKRSPMGIRTGRTQKIFCIRSTQPHQQKTDLKARMAAHLRAVLFIWKAGESCQDTHLSARAKFGMSKVGLIIFKTQNARSISMAHTTRQSPNTGSFLPRKTRWIFKEAGLPESALKRGSSLSPCRKAYSYTNRKNS